LTKRAKVLNKINAEIRAGKLAAKNIAATPDSLKPTSAARCEPTASITAPMSSFQASRFGTAPNVSASELPQPRVSIQMLRLNPPSRSNTGISVGSSHSKSTGCAASRTTTKSSGPSPQT